MISALSSTGNESPNSSTDKVKDSGNRASNPKTLTIPFSYHGFSNKIGVSDKKMHLNITTGNLMENKDWDISSKLALGSDLEIMSMAYCSTS